MRHTLIIAVFLGICLLFPVGLLGALDIEILGGVNYLKPKKDEHPYSYKPFPEEYAEGEHLEVKPFYFGSLKIKSEITENVTFDINLVRDIIYQNNLEILLGGKSDYFSFQAGPFAGMPDELEKPFLGVLGGIELMYPGIVFLGASGSYTLSREFDFGSDHERESIGVKLGFWLPNAIPYIFASYKCFTKVDEPIIREALFRYQLSIDFYSKNYPFTFRIDGGYQVLERIYDDKTRSYIDELSMYFTGFELKVQTTNKTKLLLGAEMPFLFSAKKDMSFPKNYLWSLNATVGLIISGN